MTKIPLPGEDYREACAKLFELHKNQIGSLYERVDYLEKRIDRLEKITSVMINDKIAISQINWHEFKLP